MQAPDGFDELAVQPQCPRCGTVLRDVKGGYVCVGCNEAYGLSPRKPSSGV